MARFGVLALALLASAYAAEEVCAEGQCAEGAEEAALLQSTAAQKFAEVNAHSDTCTATCTDTPAFTCCDKFNKCYKDPDCLSVPPATVCAAGGAAECRFCDCPGGGCPACPGPTPAPTPDTPAPTPAVSPYTPCGPEPAFVCGDPVDKINMCVLDPGCKPPTGLTGCNAGNYQLCRFCQGTNC